MRQYLKKNLFLLLVIVSSSPPLHALESISIIPKPSEISISNDEKISISLDNLFLKTEGIELSLAQQWLEITGFRKLPTSGMMKNSLVLTYKPETEGAIGSYRLNISQNKVSIVASSKSGLFYGVQSFRQMFPAGNLNSNVYKLPQAVIKDSPRYGWRGFMLDESRHFFGKAKVKQYLDIMALHKLNRFHWHLSDEPAWRIEIKAYPRLTSVGGKGTWSNPDTPAQFYTQKDIREIVAYAADRFIMIIPEIDMPGHASSANRAYPEFSGGGTEKTALNGVGKHPHFTFNPVNEDTFEYLSTIIKEVAAIFPSPYFHIGGDEVHFANKQWADNQDVQQLMNEKGYTSLVEVEHHFIRRVSKLLNSLGKIMVGWDEIAKAGLSPKDTSLMWWRHNMPETLYQSLEQKFPIILSPRVPMYLDFVQHYSHQSGRRWEGAFGRLETIYAMPDALYGDIANNQHIRGTQANLWTEQVSTNDRLDFMTFPRLTALAEASWSSEKNKSYCDFLKRLKGMYTYYQKAGIRAFNVFKPETTPEPTSEHKPAWMKLFLLPDKALKSSNTAKPN